MQNILTHSVFSRCFEGPKRSLKFCQRSHSRTPLHIHHQNTLKPRSVTISVFRWNTCSLWKVLTVTKVKKTDDPISLLYLRNKKKQVIKRTVLLLAIDTKLFYVGWHNRIRVFQLSPFKLINVLSMFLKV